MLTAGTKPRILVTGSEAPAGLAAVRALQQAGFEAWVAVESRTALGARSRAAAGVVDVADPRVDPDGFVTTLAAAAERVGAAAVLPGNEQGLLAMTGREEAFPESVVVGTPDERTLPYATDKIALGLLSERAGLDMPPTSVLTAGEPAANADLSFPAMVKPFRSELSADGILRRFAAARVETQAELDDALAVLPDGAGLVQPYIDGRLISVNGVFFDGTLYAANQHEVHRVWPDRCGHATYAETFPMSAERERKVAAFMEELGWRGVFNLQLIERDGCDYVIDLNPRFYVSLTLAAAAGLNLPGIWASLLLGLPFEAAGYLSGVRFREEIGDVLAIFAAVRRGELRALRGRVPRRRTVHALFSIRDPRPSMELLETCAAAVRRRVREEIVMPERKVSEDLAQADRVLVLLHGRWYKPESMQELAQRLELPRTACVTPAASERTWYPQRFMDPRAVNEPQLSDAIAQVHETLDGVVARGVDPENVVLGGFSQGSCVACEALAQRPRPLAALVSLCGGLIGKDDGEIVKPPVGALEGMPALLTGTEEDEWIPVERVQRTAEVLEAAGARVDLRIHPPAGKHEIHDWEVESFRSLMLELG